MNIITSPPLPFDQMAAASSPSLSGLTRRPIAAGTLPPPPPAGLPRPVVDPAPRTKPAFQLLALAIIAALASLQFLPATHVRDPDNPTGSWIPVRKSNVTPNKESAVESVHLVSWIDCLDLRVVAVLINSTLTTSRSPEHVYFHFLIPEAEEENLFFYKLKVLFPNSNLDITGQKEIKQKITSTPQGEKIWHLLPELAPFIISSIKPSLKKFIYVSPFAIVKESIEDLLRVDMGSYALAAAEDCDRSLGDYVNIEIVNAVQRIAAKSWISKEHYDEKACIPDLNVVVVDSNKIVHFFEAIEWWAKVLTKGKERNRWVHPPAYLALHKKYVVLPMAWKISEAKSPNKLVAANVVHFDGPRRFCGDNTRGHQGSTSGNNWQQYLSEKSELILGH